MAKAWAIDGDTVGIRFALSQREWHVRLIDCWASERNTPDGKDATQACQEFLDTADSLSVFIPAPKHIHNLLRNLTFDRIPGHIYLREDLTLSQAMVLSGHATSKKSRKTT